MVLRKRTACPHALMASERKPGILVSLHLDFVEVEAGKAVFAGVPDEHVYSPIGTVHGGYAATSLACGCALHSRLTALRLTRRSS